MRTLRPTHIFSLFAAVVSFAAASASATDILSRDDVGYVVSITTSAGAQTVQLASKQDLINACEGCTITLEDGQSVEAKADDLVFIENGELSILED